MMDQINIQGLGAKLGDLSAADQQPNPQDVIDFNNEMNQSDSSIEVIDGNTMKTDPALTVAQPDGFCDTIVRKLETMRTESKQHLSEINTMMDKAMGDGASSKELLELQVKLFQFTYQTHITTKIADKTNEGVKTLFRQQG